MISTLIAMMSLGKVDRVTDAYRAALPTVRAWCKQATVPYPPKRIFLRAFKLERTLEIWGSSSGKTPFKLLQALPIAAMSGTLGPKRMEGDGQVPEGIYTINRFNPQSQFLLSLGLNYPNDSDLLHSDSVKPGGDIFIHGDRKSIGCLAMTDPVIQRIYILCLEARNAGQSKIPVHIFPFRLEKPWQSRTFEAFWSQLQPIYESFELTKMVPPVRITRSGEYSIGR
jgi:murein L,D-transpeptidase YafK